jgi:hypothetical protein
MHITAMHTASAWRVGFSLTYTPNLRLSNDEARAGGHTARRCQRLSLSPALPASEHVLLAHPLCPSS